ncbi:MAG TPA: hypothetical protein PLD05_04245 [Thermogutta sp.]|nr:hypothetical protein [Thermogutta sp.]
MASVFRMTTGVALAGLLLTVCVSGGAQALEPAEAGDPSADPAAAAQPEQPANEPCPEPPMPSPAETPKEDVLPVPEQILGVPRRLAPGVLIKIPPDIQVSETHNRQDIVELVSIDPQLEWARNVDFRRNVYCLEFEFKLPRLITVDIPQPSGRLQQKPIWYMVYRVTNRGGALRPVLEDDGTYRIESVDVPVLFIPTFYLEGKAASGEKRYPDRVIPLAKPIIQAREDRAIQFFDSTETARTLQVGQSMWGVAMWEDVDPTINCFSIIVAGLSNAYKWTDPPGAYKVGDPVGQGRVFQRKMLKINFWRPGDEFIVKEEYVRMGQPGAVDYEWIYR